MNCLEQEHTPTSSASGVCVAKKKLKFAKIYGERHKDLWALVSLDFGLAAQGATLDEALKRLDGQIRDYIYDATVGEDKEFRDDLLKRKAPMEFFFKFYLTAFRQLFKKHLKNEIAYSLPYLVEAKI